MQNKIAPESSSNGYADAIGVDLKQVSRVTSPLDLAAQLFADDPETKECLIEWFKYGTWNDLGDRLEYLRKRAIQLASKQEKGE